MHLGDTEAAKAILIAHVSSHLPKHLPNFTVFILIHWTPGKEPLFFLFLRREKKNILFLCWSSLSCCCLQSVYWLLSSEELLLGTVKAPLFCVSEMLSEAEAGSSARHFHRAHGVWKLQVFGFWQQKVGWLSHELSASVSWGRELEHHNSVTWAIHLGGQIKPPARTWKSNGS